MENSLLSSPSHLINMPPSFCIMGRDPCDLHWFGETCLKAELSGIPHSLCNLKNNHYM